MFDPQAYGKAIASILEPHQGGARLMPLAPSGPLQGEALTQLRRLSSRELFAATPIAAEDFADCVRSALFLYLSDLDASHTISQNIPTATGSYLHGIMHRQEPDFSNAKYWFRRVGSHEVLAPLRAAALEALQPGSGAESGLKSSTESNARSSTESGTESSSTAAKPLRSHIETRPQWDPFWFIDQCEAAGHGGADLDRHLREIQRLEWQLLFDYSYRKAVGAD
jgi:hypothetical protein